MVIGPPVPGQTKDTKAGDSEDEDEIGTYIYLNYRGGFISFCLEVLSPLHMYKI